MGICNPEMGAITPYASRKWQKSQKHTSRRPKKLYACGNKLPKMSRCSWQEISHRRGFLHQVHASVSWPKRLGSHGRPSSVCSPLSRLPNDQDEGLSRTLTRRTAPERASTRLRIWHPSLAFGQPNCSPRTLLTNSSILLQDRHRKKANFNDDQADDLLSKGEIDPNTRERPKI